MMKARTIGLVSAATLALAACGSKQEAADNGAADTVASDTANGTMSAPPAMSDSSAAVGLGQGFANAAAASDAFEIATSELAITTSKSAAIKAFARQMVSAHTESTAKLKTAAASASPAITPDPMLTAEQQQTLDGLRNKAGADFDAAYVAAQKTAHQATLDAVRGYAGNGDVPQLKAFATALVPTVTAHLNMAKGLKP